MKKSMRLKSLMVVAGMTIGLFAHYPAFPVNAAETGGTLSIGRNTVSQESEEDVYTYALPAGEKVYINLIGNGGDVNPAVVIDAEYEYSDFSIDGTSQKICIENYDDEEEKLSFRVKSGIDSGFDINIQSWPFSDVPETMKGADEIVNAYLKGVVNGTGYDSDGKTKFNHNKTVTRVQFAIMLYNMAENVYGIDMSDAGASDITFNDINEGNAGYKEVVWASSNGIINGFRNKDGSYSFKPNNAITRQQMALLLMGLAKQMNGDTAVSDAKISNAADFAKIGDTFTNAMSWACGTEILSGLSKNGGYYVKPADGARRSQTAMFISRFLNYYDPALKPGELELDSEYFIINSRNTCKFSVEIPEETCIKPMVNYGDNERAAINLNDDEIYGDEEYGDGIYQCDFEFFSDKKGEDEVYLSVNGWNTNKVKVFYFSDEVTDEDLLLEAEVLNGMSEINDKYDDEDGYVSFDNIDAVMAEMSEYADGLLKAGKAVVVEKNDLNIYVKLVTGLPVIYSPNLDGFMNGGDENDIQIITMETVREESLNKKKLKRSVGKIQESANEMSQKIARVSFSEDNEFVDSGVTVGVLGNVFGKNQIVIFWTHGKLKGEDEPLLFTSSSYNEDSRVLYIDELVYDELIPSVDNPRRFCVSHRYILKKYRDGKKLEGSFIYLAACFSGYSDKLANAFLECGAECVIGNSDTIYANYNVDMVQSVMKYLGNTNILAGRRYTISEAYDKALKEVGEIQTEYVIKNDLDLIKDYSSDVHPILFKKEGSDYCLGYKYRVFDSFDGTWEEAEAYCESLGGHLATISSQAENDYIYSIMKSSGIESAYIGYTDKDEEGVWKWIDGTESTYTNWAEGEPDDDEIDEDYAMFYYKFPDGKWNDGDFGNLTIRSGTAFICEWDEY